MHLANLKLISAFILLLPTSSLGINVVVSNDDGWAEANVRVFYNALRVSSSPSYSVVLSSPAENKSGSGSTDVIPTLRTTPCQFNTCPAGSASYGFNASDPRLNWVNSFPVTAMKYGIQTLAPKFFNGATPDIALSGPNVGSNTGSGITSSGTVGAACEAAKEGIPAIAFSGRSGDQISFTSPLEEYMTNYASLAVKLSSTLINAGPKPYLPRGVFLNVNFPKSPSKTCKSPRKFKYTLTRIDEADNHTDDDVKFCGKKRLREEAKVNKDDGCWVSVSVGNATSKKDVNASTQKFVLDRLDELLECM